MTEMTGRGTPGDNVPWPHSLATYARCGNRPPLQFPLYSEWLAAGIAMAAMSRLYRASLLSSAFGCVFAPILITAGSCLLLPTTVTLGVVCVFVVILAIPAQPRPPIVNRILRDATDTAREYFNITIKHDAAKFQRSGPYVIGDVHA
jgi:hypothetical protein